MSPKTVLAQRCALAALLVSTTALLILCKKNTVYPNSPTAPITSPVADTSSLSTTTGTVYVTSKPINLNGEHGVTIKGKSITGGTVPCITLTNCYNIRIVANQLYNSTDVGVLLLHCRNITVVKNYISHVSSGVYAVQAPEGRIAVDSNQFLNMQGPYPRGQFVQFDNVKGSGNSISNNKCQNILGASDPEDAISLYQCYGVAGNPIMITGNWIEGGGPSKTGGGIMLGDTGGAYLTASGNTLVNPGQYGIAISGGDHNVITHNRIYGASQSFTNVGIYVASYGGSTATNSTVSYNEVNYYNSFNQSNSEYLQPGVATPTGWSTNTWNDKTVTSKILPAAIVPAIKQ